MGDLEVDEHHKPTTSLNVSRRQALKMGAAVGVAAAWTVPLVQAITMTAAGAQATSGGGDPLPPVCTGRAYDLRAVLTGAIAEVVDPIQDSTGVTDCEASPAFAVDGGPVIATASADCVTGGCPATFSLASGSIDLTGVGIPIAASFGAVTVMAHATCGADATSFSVADFAVSVSGVDQTGALDPDGDTLDLSGLTPGLTGFIALKEVAPIPDGTEANFLHIVATMTPEVGAAQTIDLRFGHAESSIVGCP